MPRGGSRSGAGRPKGAASKTNEVARAEAAASGMTPLEYMLGVLRNAANDREIRMDAAKAAAPYVHSKLAAVELSGNLKVNHEDALDELDAPGTEDQAET